jgi:DNA-binding MarR family transcriptional regulator
MGRRSRAEIVSGILERDRDTLALSVQLDRAMPDAAQPDLTMRQVLALYLLLEAPRRVGELARELNVTISSASGLVDRLVAAGLVEREHGTADRRLVVCRLTGPGRRELEAFLQLGRLRLERVLAGIAAQDLLVVQRAQDLLIAAARDAIAEHRAG